MKQKKSSNGWGTTKKPSTIKSHLTADRFFYWLAEHTEVRQIQGWRIMRLDDGRPHCFFGAGIWETIDVDSLYARRKELNDWIRSL